MAYIRDYAISIEAAATTSMVCEMPTHETGDLLVAAVNKDATPSFNLPAGWTAVQTQASAGSYGGVYAKRAASASETVTFTYANETACAVVIAVGGCYGSTVAHATDTSAKTGADDTAVPFAGSGCTTNYDNSLIIHSLSTDTGFGPFALPPLVNIFAGDAGANSLCVGYTFQKAYGAVSAPSFWGQASGEDTRGFVFAVRDDGNNTRVSPYIAVGTTPAYLLALLMNNVAVVNNGNFKTATPLDITTVGAKTLTYIAYATNSADAGYNPFHGVLRFNATSSKVILYGQELTFTTPATDGDFTRGSGILFGTWTPTAPRDYVDVSKSAAGGVMVGIADEENDYKFWTIAGQYSKTTNPRNRQNFAIQVNGSSDTSYATSGTIAYNSINDIYFVAQAYYGATSLDFSQIWCLNETQILGGTSSYPLNFLDIEMAVNKGSGDVPLMVRSGSAAVLWTRIKFGGADATHILVNLRTLQYPTKADEVDYLDFHVDNNHMGVEFYGLNNDSIKFTNCVFTSDSSYYWRFNSSHNSGCALDFSGTSVVNATVTLRSTVTLTSTTFIDCTTFTQNSAVLTSCTFSNTKVTSAAPADTALISSCSFTKTTGTQHAIEIGGSAANFDFNGNTFTGYAVSDGSTGNEAIYVNIASGTMTITITGSGSIPSIRTAGASIAVSKPVTLTVTVKDEQNNNIQNARVSIQGANTSSMLGAVADDGGSQTNETTASNNATTNDMNLVAASGAIVVDDAYYFGSAEPFYKLTINIGQNGVGAWAVEWKYYNGTNFNTTIPDVNDGSNGFKAGTGNRDITFSPPSNWAVTTIQGISAYWVKARISTGDASPGTRAKGTQAWVYQQIMNELTTAGGVATESFNYSADTSIIIRVRKSSTGSTRYIPVNTTGTITSTGFSLTQILIVDTIAEP